MSSKLRIAFGVPAYGGQITVEQMQMWFCLGNTLGGSSDRFELAWLGYKDAQPIDRTRNLLVEEAIKAKADWLLMIDADTFVVSTDPNTDAGFYLLRMISDADRAGATIVAAPYMLRVADQPSTYMAVYLKSDEHNPKFPPGLKPIERGDCFARMFEAYAVGTGCMAINLRKLLGTAPIEYRRVWGADEEIYGGVPHGEEVETVKGIEFQFTDDLSEDLDFCQQVREAGGRILVDGRVMTGHMSRSFPLYSRVA